MPDKSSPLHRAAREWAESGFPIFPITPNAKTPATENGWKDSTTDLAQIDAWWTENPNYNIGWSPELSGMLVLDTDPPLGDDTLEKIVAQEGEWPQTYTVLTPRGGHHYWLKGSAASSVQKLGPKLDTRGRGGYVLVPPSIVNGKEYTILDDRDPADAPEWINRRLAMKEEHHVSGTEDLDQPTNLARARAVLRRRIDVRDVAIEGAGGDARTVQQAFELRDLGVSEQCAFKLMSGDWNAACVPPWDADELEAKVHNAFSYAQNDEGAYAIKPPAEAFVEFLKTHKPEPLKRSRFYAFSEDEQEAWPEPSWIIPDVLPDEATVMLYGPSRSYKSFLALDLALALAYGKPSIFGAQTDLTPVPTLFVAGESPRGLSRQRRPAWKLAHEVEGNGQFYMVKAMPSLLNGGMGALREQIREQGLKPKLIVIDTLAKAMAGMNENDARDAGVFIEAVEAMRDEFGATILMIHHTGKEAERGARGSSAFFNGFDTVLEAQANNATNTVAVMVRKQKDADEREEPFTFQGKMVGPGLVFMPMDSTEYATINKKTDQFDHQTVGAALMSLGAKGPNRGVTSMTLASVLAPLVQGQDEAARADVVLKTSRKLTRFAKDHLEAYVTGEGRDLKWSLP